MPNPFELQNLRQRLKSLAEVCPQNGSMQARQQLVAAAFGLSSDLSFLSQLFDVCAEACKDLKGCQGAAQTCIMGAAAALLYLPGRGLKVLQQFLDCVFMPMLTSSRLPSQVYLQIASSLCSLLASEAGWAQLSGLLHICRQGLQKAGSVGSDASDAGGKKPGDMLCMPLHTCCCLAPSILEACCQPTPESTPTALEGTHAESEAQTVALRDEAGLDPHAQELLSSALETLLPQALDSIGCPNAPLRKANFHHILPALLSSSRALGVQTLHATMAAIWDACLSLLPMLGIPRQTALAVMVQLTPLLQEQGEACMARVWHDALFWERLRVCLAGDDALDRKRGAYLLQRLMPPTCARMPAWKTWLLLHDALDGFAPHLIYTAMAEMDKLHLVCQEPHHKYPAQSPGTFNSIGKASIKQKTKTSTKESEADTEGEQIRVVGTDEQGSADGAENGHILDADAQQAPDAVEQLSSCGAGLPNASPHHTAMAWLCVLWQRALQHRNLQVQRAGLRQFLQRLWESDALSPVPDEQSASSASKDAGALLRRGFRHSDVPFGFIVEVLIPAVCKDIHYKGRANEAWDTQAAARAWLTEWLRHQPEHAQRDFLRFFLATLNTAGAEGFVQGLSALTGCIASAQDLHKGLSDSDAAASSQDFLATLHILILRLQNFHNLQPHSQKRDADLRLEVHHCLLHIAHCAAPVGHVRVADAARFISEIPSQDTVPGGELNTAACAYLLALSNHLSAPKPTNQFSQQPPLKTSNQHQPSTQAQPLPTISWDAAAVQAAQSALKDLHVSMAQYQVSPPGVPFFEAGHIEALERHARLLSLAALICGSCPDAAHVSSLLTSAAQDLWPLYQRAYVHPIELMKRIVLLKEVLGGAVAQGACWHGAQPLLHVLVEVCTSSTEALCSLGKSALGAFVPASANRGVSSSVGDSSGEPGGAGCCLSDQRAAREREQQQLQARAVVEAMGAVLVLLARMRPSLPAPRCAKLHSFLDALASTLLTLVASVQAIRPFTSPGAHSDEETSELGAHPGLKTSAPSPTGLSATQPPESQSADSIPSTASMAPPAGSAQPRASAAAQHHFALLGVVQSTCRALCEAAEDASVGAAVSAGLQPHEVLRALLLLLRGVAAGNRGISTRIWGCLDALMSLARKAAPHSRQSSLPAISFGDEPLPGKPPAGRPTFVLRQDVLPQLLLAALEELERGNNGDVFAVLRCFRRAWVQLLEDLGDAQMQEGVTIALISHPGVEQPSLLDVAWRAVRAVCAAMKASRKKHPTLAAAFISALLPPKLIPSPSKHAGTSASGRGHPDAYEPQLTDTDAQSPRAACRNSVDLGGLGCLHDAKGPVPWAINCILEWGFSSPSVMLLLSCHLASLIIRRPQLLKMYAPQLQQILMQSADGMDCGSLMRRTLSTPSTEMERELGTVLPSADQAWLFDSLKSPGLAARAAVLCALHHLAEHAGLVWHPSHGGSSEGQAQTSHSSSLAAHHARNPGNPAEPASPRKRPVIIFEEGGGWEDVRQPPGPGSATKSTHGTIPAVADVGSRVYDAYAESGSSNGGLKKGIGSAGRLPLSQASCSSQEGAPYSSSYSSSAHSSSSYSLRQGLSMLGRLTGESKPGPDHEGTDNYPRSGGRAAGGLDHGKHGMKSAIGPSGSHVHQSVSEGGWALWRAMLHVASARTDICTDKVKRDSDTHCLKVRVWQALAVLTSFVQPPHIEASLRSVIALMSSNDAPSVKQYQEATAAALLVKEPDLLETIVLSTLESYQKPHPGIGSLVLVAVQVCLHASERDHLLPKLLYATVPWLSSHAHSVRSYAQLVVYALLRQFPPECPIWSHTGGDRTYIQRLFQFLEDNLEFQRLCRNVGLPSMDWNPEGLASPRRLLCGETALIQQTAETLSFEGAPTTLLDRLIGFLQEEHIRLRKEMDKRAADTEELERQARQRCAPSLGYNSRDHAHGLDFQRKVTTSEQTSAVAGSRQGFWGSGFRHEGSGTGGLYEGLFECGLGDLLVLSESSPSAKGDGDNSVEGQGGEHQGTFRSRADGREQRVGMEAGARASGGGSCRRRQELIVVASLLDKAENLAGLSRTCEVFRAGLLVVPDLKVVSDPLFQTISVTAEKWVPIVEVREEALLEWLQDRKAEGFTCVGLEQTVESCKLPSYSFPNRCVLVLGKEKEGLPPEVIQMLDDSVEIPQLGLIRSLNVHVSGAIAMYEYTRQRASPDHS